MICSIEAFTTSLIAVGSKLYRCISLNHTCTGILVVEEDTATKA
jgi:hypothetical protein